MNCRSALKQAAVLLLISCGLPVLAQDRTSVLIVDLYLNQQHMGDTFVLRADDGQFFVDETVLDEWQIRKPWPDAKSYRGIRYYSISEFAGAEASFISRRMELQIFVPANLMPLRTVDMQIEQNDALVEDLGAYLDYEVNWLNQTSNNSRNYYSLLRPVLFGSFGNISANISHQHQSGGDAPAGNSGNGLHVLSLTYTRDDPSRLRTLQVGDIITNPGTQGRSLRIGGIQLATNFATQPTFVTYPLPSFYGETTVPSALDIYVNGRLRRSEEVQPGQYVLEDIPVVNGAGQMQVVTRDALGRQQVYSQDFYVSSDLLRKGLSDYSFNLGALREEYGIDNFSYGDLAGSANYRYGLKNDLTIEGHLEFSDDLVMIGGAGQYSIKSGGTLRGGIGLSNGNAGFGTRWQIGFRQISELLNYNVEISGSSEAFDLVGNYTEVPKLQFVGSAGKSYYEFGSVGMSVVHQSFWQSQKRTLVSANYSKTFRNYLSLSAFVSHIRTDDTDVVAGIRFSMPLGDRHHSYGGLSFNESGPTLEGILRRNVPIGSGYGYHVGVGLSDNNFVDAGVMAQSEYGTYTLDVRSNESSGSFWQAGTRGSLAYLSGVTKFSRQIRDAFAVVKVGEIEGVRVYAENQEIGRTDKNGQIFVPGLQPYYKNQLSIEVDDLPLSASIERTRANTTPYYRSGVVVNFNVRLSNNVLLRAVLPDGSPVPEGAVVQVRYPDKVFPVGIDGKVYIEGVDRSSLIEIRWGSNRCELDVPFATGAAIIEKMGDILCEPLRLQ